MSYDKITDRAREVMRLAKEEAYRLKHTYVGPEHVLLGLVMEGKGMGANALRAYDYSLRAIREAVEGLLSDNSPEIIAAHKSRQTQKVIEFAFDASRELHQAYVSTEHLLLGLLREQESMAGKLLREHGLTFEGVREEILRDTSSQAQSIYQPELVLFCRDLAGIVGCPYELVPKLAMQLCELRHYDRIRAIAKEALAEIKR